MGDIVDEDRLKSGINRAGKYSALSALMVKANFALGGSIGFYVINIFGYRFHVENSQTAISGLLFTVLIFPTILSVIGGIILWFFPLTKKRHAEILEQLTGQSKEPEPRFAGKFEG